MADLRLGGWSIRPRTSATDPAVVATGDLTTTA
jgi:hypothetical protein